MNLATVDGEVGQHDAQIHSSSESTRAETADRSRRDFGKVNRADNNCLADANACNKASGVDGLKAAAVDHKDDDANNPQDAELTGCPETANSIADNECTIIKGLSVWQVWYRRKEPDNVQQSAGNAAQLDHA